MSQPKPEEISRRKLCSGRVLELQAVTWQAVDGSEHEWEAVNRIGDRAAVLMIPRLAPSGDLVLIRQYRPPIGDYIIEFPAGIIDDGEAPTETAIRELIEETGYTGSITTEYPPAYNSPGLSGEFIHIMLMDIDENAPENQNPQPKPEPSEHIEVLVIPAAEAHDFYQQEIKNGTHFDSKVAAYILAMNAQ